MRTVRCYCLGQDGGFRGWYDSQPNEVKARIHSVLELLCALPHWRQTPFYEPLRGKCDGLGEIKVELQGAHYRFLGYEDSDKGEFTILRWFRKETNADYGSHCPQALKRKEQVLKDASRSEPWPFTEDEDADEEVPE
jgi:hypothetical protein